VCTHRGWVGLAQGGRGDEDGGSMGTAIVRAPSPHRTRAVMRIHVAVPEDADRRGDAGSAGERWDGYGGSWIQRHSPRLLPHSSRSAATCLEASDFHLNHDYRPDVIQSRRPAYTYRLVHPRFYPLPFLVRISHLRLSLLNPFLSGGFFFCLLPDLDVPRPLASKINTRK
jgi:hypothetical protein